MKIYPSKSSITVTKEVNPLTDIPLSYIDTNATDYNISTLVNEKYKLKERKEILPYDKVSNSSICLFDENGNQIPQEALLKNFKRDGNEYIYIPNGSQVFTPKRFKYDVTAKKKMQYSSNVTYNLNVLVPNSNIMAHQFMPICGDAPSRLISPANILINNGDVSFASLTEGNMTNKDFVMMSFADRNTMLEYDYYYDEMIEVPYDSDILLDMYSTNLIAVFDESYAEKDWDEDDNSEAIAVSEDDERAFFCCSKEAIDYKITSPILYNNLSVKSKYYFTVPRDSEERRYHNIFNNKNNVPILIEETLGKGFKIYMSQGIIENSVENSKIIYDILMKVYLMAYLKVTGLEEWIADEVPDYIVNNKKLIKKDKFVSNVELHKMFGVNSNEVSPYLINIDKELYPFVKFTGMYKDYLTFEKDLSGDNSKYADPIKPDNALSIYTQKQNIMFYDKFIYSINDSIEDIIKVERLDDSIQVNLKQFKHSSTGIYVKYIPDPIIIPLIKVINNKEEQILNADFYLVCIENDSASYFEVVNSEDYKEEHGEILITIQVRQSSNKKIVYDMRQRGGGLPLEDDDNFNCFDIGHIKGRPYRKAGTLIITLPKYLEQYKEIISETIKQYSSAEDYPIIIFKED